MGTIAIGKRFAATDIFWQTGPKTDAEAKGRAKHLASIGAPDKDQAPKFICVRRTTPINFGVSGPGQQHHARMISAAAALAKKLPGSWAGVFPVKEGYYFVHCPRGHIAADNGDVLYPPEKKNVLAPILANIAQAGVVEKIYGPADILHAASAIVTEKRISLGFEKIEEPTPEERQIEARLINASTLLLATDTEKSLYGLLGGKPSLFSTPPRLTALDAKLSDSVRSSPTWLIGGLGIAALAGGIAVFLLTRHNVPETKEHPFWEQLPIAEDVINKCASTMMSFGEFPGYVFRSGQCTATTVLFNYDGYAAEQKYYYATEPPPANCTKSLKEGGQLAIGCKPTSFKKHGHQNRLTAAEAQRIFWQSLSGFGLKLKVTLGSEPVPPTELAENEPVPSPVKVIAFETTGPVFPGDYAAVFTQLPASTVAAVSYSFPDNWLVKGKIYVR